MTQTPQHLDATAADAGPQPVRDDEGAPILGPHNRSLERDNLDVLVPPETDAGTVPNLKYSFAAAHNRLLSGGWAREVTVRARTFDYLAGDVGYVPFAMGHYVENTGDEPVCFLELFRSDRFADVSLSQWMALTPPELVQGHLNIDPRMLAALSRDKPIVVR